MNAAREFFAGLFRPASPEVLAARELDEARRQLLAAESAAEYADAMCAYHRSRIDRLQRYLKGEQE